MVATKQHVSTLHTHIGGVENEDHWCGRQAHTPPGTPTASDWCRASMANLIVAPVHCRCGLDWSVGTQQVFVPKDEDGNPQTAVVSLEDLPVDAVGFTRFYIYHIRKTEEPASGGSAEGSAEGSAVGSAGGSAGGSAARLGCLDYAYRPRCPRVGAPGFTGMPAKRAANRTRSWTRPVHD